jgi:hypothetical protein
MIDFALSIFFWRFQSRGQAREHGNHPFGAVLADEQ